METKKANISLNCSYVGGHLTNDPEYKMTSSGIAIANFTVAVNRKYKSGEEWKEEAEYIRIKCFKNIAERAKSILSKGTSIIVIGRIHTSSWEDNGVKKYITEVIADNFQKIDPSNLEGKPKQEKEEETEEDLPREDDIDVKDIPF